MTCTLKLLSLCLVGLATCKHVTGEQCRQGPEKKPCTCETDKATLSLQELMNSRNGQPLSVTDMGYTYYINPCDIQTPSPCRSLSPLPEACQVDGSLAVYGLGAIGQQAVVGDPEAGTVAFLNRYKGLDQNIRVMRLELSCTEDTGNLRFTGQSTQSVEITYNFILDTKYACLSAPDAHSSEGLSAGSVMVILFFVALIVYLVGGVLFLKFVRKAEGRESIPNYEFWSDFPSLVKDGVMFTCRGCKAESTYEQI